LNFWTPILGTKSTRGGTSSRPPGEGKIRGNRKTVQGGDSVEGMLGSAVGAKELIGKEGRKGTEEGNSVDSSTQTA